jgi:toxin-antitoxin system PIN domain toxin
VTLVDANVLLYAVDRSARHHEEAKAWLDRALSGRETVAMPWICLLAFVRIATHPAIYPRPLEASQALDVVEAWLGRRNVIVPSLGAEHLPALREAIEATGTAGNLVNDAHLAAIARRSDATVVTFDGDFARFPGIRWRRPSRA